MLVQLYYLINMNNSGHLRGHNNPLSRAHSYVKHNNIIFMKFVLNNAYAYSIKDMVRWFYRRPCGLSDSVRILLTGKDVRRDRNFFNLLPFNQNGHFILDIYVGIIVGCIWMYFIISFTAFYVTSLHIMKGGLIN